MKENSTSSEARKSRKRIGSILEPPAEGEEHHAITLLRENITLHGVRDSWQAFGWLRVTWICILVATSLAALVGCYFIVLEFNERPLSVSLSIQTNESLTLPDIIMCPFNRFNRTFFQQLNISDALAQYIELTFPETTLSLDYRPFQRENASLVLQQVDRYEAELDQLLAQMGNVTLGDLLNQAAIGCEAFSPENPEQCNQVHSYLTPTGQCFRFRGEDQTVEGNGYMQRLIVQLPKELYTLGVMLNDGLMITLVGRDRGISNADLSFVPAGVHVLFQLKATRYQFLHYPPHHHCLRETKAGYSPSHCIQACVSESAQNLCNCSIVGDSQAIKERICTRKDLLQCYYTQFFRAYNEGIVPGCKQKCPPPCHFWRFDKSVTYADFPSSMAKKLVKKGTADWEQLKNTIILDFYYDSLDYIYIEQFLSMTPASFVAQLGGQMSLWLGASLISLVQLLIYLSTALFGTMFLGRKGVHKSGDKDQQTTATGQETSADQKELVPMKQG